MYLLPEHLKYIPHPLLANEDGVLAIGGSLDPDFIIQCYNAGVFPWYDEDPIIWWYTFPRFVLFPQELKIQKSMRTYLNQEKYKVTFDQDFSSVIHHCKQIKRNDQTGTWLNDELVNSMIILHNRGIAKSVEVWDGDDLVGGVYGLLIGKMFFGESMFSLSKNASKLGFIKLVQKLEASGIELIDCQQETEHLKSFGARKISKIEFWKYIKANWLYQLK